MQRRCPFHNYLSTNLARIWSFKDRILHLHSVCMSEPWSFSRHWKVWDKLQAARSCINGANNYYPQTFSSFGVWWNSKNKGNILTIFVILNIHIYIYAQVLWIIGTNRMVRSQLSKVLVPWLKGSSRYYVGNCTIYNNIVEEQWTQTLIWACMLEILDQSNCEASSSLPLSELQEYTLHFVDRSVH